MRRFGDGTPASEVRNYGVRTKKRPADPATYAEARTAVEVSKARSTAAQAEMAELKLAQLRSELVPAADVVREWSDVLRMVRQAMLAVTNRVRQRLPALTAADAAEIDAEIRAVLRETAGSGDEGGPA